MEELAVGVVILIAIALPAEELTLFGNQLVYVSPYLITMTLP
jgi:hypothetical protein